MDYITLLYRVLVFFVVCMNSYCVGIYQHGVHAQHAMLGPYIQYSVWGPYIYTGLTHSMLC
jgi:hypothetical protein